MKERRLIFLVLLMSSFIFINFVCAQDGVPANPSDNIIAGLGGYSDRGYPESYEKYIEFSNTLVEREQNYSYWQKSMTGIFAKSPLLGPFFYYTQKFFSFFDPLWEYTFGMAFDWNIAFFAHVGLYITLIILLYYPVETLFENKLGAVFVSIVIASIVGGTGVITYFVGILEVMFVNLFYLTLGIVLIVLFLILYIKLFRKGEKEAEEEELRRARESIKTQGKVSQRALEKFSDGGGI